MATKKFPSEMSSRGTVLGTDKILIYNATTGASDEVCTVAELFAYVYSAVTTGRVPYKSATVLADSPLFISEGNVGIGTVSPTAILQLGNYLTNSGQIISFLATNETAGNVRARLDFAGVNYGTVNDTDAWKWTLGTIAAAGTSGENYNSNFVVMRTIRNGAGSIPDNIDLVINKLGNIGIAKTDPNYRLEIGSDSAGKPGAGGLWTVVSDARIKKDIELADLDICYDTIKNIPLKRFAWADGVYSEEQVSDRHNLGWIAQDVQKYFSKAVSVKPFTKNAKIADGTEEYQEQDFVMEDKKVTSIEIINGSPVQVTKTVQEKVLLFDELPVKDELGKVVLENGKPLLAKVPKMVTKTRPKFRQEVIEDCLDLNSGQLNAALYGAVQACMLKIESLEQEIALLKQ